MNTPQAYGCTRRVFLRRYLNQLYHASKVSAKRRLNKGRLDAGQHDITLESIEELWKTQNGRCYYSNIQMQFNKNEWKVSLERLDTTKGYIKENVVLCCLEFNVRSQWSLSKIDDVLNLIDKNINNVNTEFEAKLPRQQSEGEIQTMKKGGRATLYGHLSKLCASACFSAKQRGKKEDNKTFRGDFELDLPFLIDIYNKQFGVCAYSGIPMHFGVCHKNNWVASLERLDVSKGYTRDNVCLICVEFNGPDHTMITGSDYGCAGWNPLKFQYFLAHVQHKKGLITAEELQAVIDVQEYFKEKGSNTRTVKSPQQKALKQVTLKEINDAIQLQKRKYKNAHELYGYIYVVTSPSGKQFVGQFKLLFHKETQIFTYARKYGYTSLIKEIDEYGEDKMSIQPIATCRKDILDYYQDYFIKEYNTLEPNGLNFKTKVRDDVKERISQTLINNVVRQDANGEQLPKYVKFIDWKDRRGYAVVSHPRCKLKYFVSNKKPLPTLKEQCIAFLNSLDKNE
jgi:hypothetical protein